MKSPVRNIILTATAVVVLTGLISAGYPQQQSVKWLVPAEYKNMKNPVKASPESVEMGSMLYKKYCISCHGKAGLGDGTKARSLNSSPSDFSSSVYQNQTDGEQFYKSKTGRNDMPAFDKNIADEDIWNLVNYMRTFKK